MCQHFSGSYSQILNMGYARLLQKIGAIAPGYLLLHASRQCSYAVCMFFMALNA